MASKRSTLAAQGTFLMTEQETEGRLISIHQELQDFANLEVPDSLQYDDEQEMSIEDVAQARSMIRLLHGAIERAAEKLDSLLNSPAGESDESEQKAS